MKSFFIYFMCFMAALVVSVVIAKIAGAFNKSPPHVISIVDSEPERAVIRVPETEPETETEEPEEITDESEDTFYRRIVYIPERVISVDFEESEEEYLAPELEVETTKSTFDKAFSTYVYNGERKKLPASEKLQEIVYKYAEKYDLPFRTVLALLGVETTWNEDPNHVEVHSGVRYIGIGCICEKYHAKNLAEKGIDIYTLDGNVEGICYLLSAQRDRFGNTTYAVMAYNGGAGYTKAQIENGVSENSYTRRVKTYAESFR